MRLAALSASFAVGKRRHDLIADRLDDRAVVLLGRRTHDLDAGQHHVAGAQIAHDFVDARAADDIGEQDGEFYVFSHDLSAPNRLRPDRPVLNDRESAWFVLPTSSCVPVARAAPGPSGPGALALYTQRNITSPGSTGGWRLRSSRMTMVRRSLLRCRMHRRCALRAFDCRRRPARRTGPNRTSRRPPRCAIGRCPAHPAYRSRQLARDRGRAAVRRLAR